jgi:hypothetical protein
MTDQREIRNCDRCGSPFHPVRERQRFCTTQCHDQFYMEERRRALAAWRAQRRLNGSLVEKAREALASIPMNIPAEAKKPTFPKHKCKGCGQMTTNERFCSAKCRMKFFSHYQDAEADSGRKFVRRI